jgi:RNase adapter protein RapZ
MIRGVGNVEWGVGKSPFPHPTPHSPLPLLSMTPQLIIITGLSGAGMSSAMNVFEDLGYFCVDNLPSQLIPSFVHLFERKESGVMRAALGLNIREGGFLESFPQVYAQLHGRDDIETTILFMEASDAVLQRRYSETRRPHPLGAGRIIEAIGAEARNLEPIRALADIVIDTSDHTVHTLRAWLRNRFAPENAAGKTEITVISFGFKYGVPLDADLVFDVRFLPNPHFVPELKDLSGNDPPVVEYLNKSEEARETVRRFCDMLDFLMPLYQREGKSYVTVAVGCTGGRHRSVAVANEIGKHLNRSEQHARVTHRDVKK